MLVLGLQGSPRKKGNTNYLTTAFMDAAQKLGADTQVVHAAKVRVEPCKELIVCEKQGYCPIKDDMNDVYALLRRAEVVVLATPVFFYNTTAQLKAMIDRSQTLWARTYKLNLKDPGSRARKGFMLSVGATKGKNLFEGLHLTAKYFFDAVGASYEGSLTYRRIEHPGDMERHPTVLEDVDNAVKGLITPLLNRKKVLFLCRENACRSQMAAAFARLCAGDKIDAMSAGSNPAERVNPLMIAAMQDKGIDMEYCSPAALNDVLKTEKPELIVAMGCEDACPVLPGVKIQTWDLPDPAGKPMTFMKDIRDQIENRVQKLMKEIVE